MQDTSRCRECAPIRQAFEQYSLSIAELSVASLLLERREEGLIERAAAEGQEVLRRPEASPLAVLGVVIVKQAQAAHVA